MGELFTQFVLQSVVMDRKHGEIFQCTKCITLLIINFLHSMQLQVFPLQFSQISRHFWWVNALIYKLKVGERQPNHWVLLSNKLEYQRAGLDTCCLL